MAKIGMWIHGLSGRRHSLVSAGLLVGMLAFTSCDASEGTAPTETPALPSNGLAIATQSLEAQSSISQPEQNAEAVVSAAGIGDLVPVDSTTLAVLGWDYLPGDDLIIPDEGNVFVAVDLLVVNEGAEVTRLSSLAQYRLQDATGQTYNLDFDAQHLLDAPVPEGVVLPGERLRGKVGFQIPRNSGALTFVYYDSLMRDRKITFDLGTEPQQASAPPKLQGETYSVTGLATYICPELGEGDLPGWLKLSECRDYAPEGFERYPEADVVTDVRFIDVQTGAARGGTTVFVYSEREDAVSRFESIIESLDMEVRIEEYGPDGKSMSTYVCLYPSGYECVVQDTVLEGRTVINSSFYAPELDTALDVELDYFVSVELDILDICQ